MCKPVELRGKEITLLCRYTSLHQVIDRLLEHLGGNVSTRHSQEQVKHIAATQESVAFLDQSTRTFENRYHA